MSNQRRRRRKIVELYYGGNYLVATGGGQGPLWPPHRHATVCVEVWYATFGSDGRWNVSTLQRAYKWQYPTKNLSTGNVVLLAEDGMISTRWPIAKVTSYPGNDGIMRVVDVKTSKGMYCRPAQEKIHKTHNGP